MNRLQRFFFVLLHMLVVKAYGQFIDVSTQQGIFIVNEGTVWGNGASFKDFNHDGWDDITSADGSDAIRFYLNNGNGDFISDSISINFTFSGQIIGVLWIDYDNDLDEDLLVTQWGGRLLLFKNDGQFNFTEVGIEVGFPAIAKNYFGAATGDTDRDGDLDIIVSIYHNPQISTDQIHSARFYRNDGDGYFTDMTSSVGLLFEPRPNFQPVIADFNKDLWPDVYFVIDRYAYPNEFFLNNGDGTFTTFNNLNGLEMAIDAMSATIGDMDNDLDEDVFISNTIEGNWLMENDSGSYVNIAASAGVLCNLVCWGANWVDQDNNGYQDLFVGATNAWFNATINFWFVNNGNKTFTNDLSLFGALPDVDPTFCNIIGDINNDGYVDYYNNNNDPRPSRLWKNTTQSNHFVSISLEGTYSHHSAVGARIELFADTLQQVRQLLSGESFLAQNSAKEFFGLGPNIYSVDSLVIYWPRGLVERYYDLEADTLWHFVEGNSLLSFQNLQVEDGNICPGQTTTIFAAGSDSVVWNTGSIGNHLPVDSIGAYWADIYFSEGFSIRTDTLIVLEDEIANVIVTTTASCLGEATGEILVTADFDEALHIIWSDLISDSLWLRDGLIADTYHFSITSESGCFYQDSVLVDMTPHLEFDVVMEELPCATSDSVLVKISSTGLDSILNQASSNFFLPEGFHTIELIDTLGCITPIELEVQIPDSLSLNLEVSPATDFDLGILNWNASGGTPPYSIDLGEIINSTGSLALPSGEYVYILYDHNGCELGGEVLIELITSSEEIGVKASKAYAWQQQLFWQSSVEYMGIKVYTTAGQLLFHSDQRNGSLPIAQWSNQLLIVRVGNDTFRIFTGIKN